MKTAIIIDSTAYANESIRNHPDVYELVLTATFKDGTQFSDSSNPDIQKEFYEKLKTSENLPKTYQPALGDYMKIVIEIIVKSYEHFMCIFILVYYNHN